MNFTFAFAKKSSKTGQTANNKKETSQKKQKTNCLIKYTEIVHDIFRTRGQERIGGHFSVFSRSRVRLQTLGDDVAGLAGAARDVGGGASGPAHT